MTQEHDRPTVQPLLLLPPLQPYSHHRCRHGHCARRLNGGGAGGKTVTGSVTVRLAPTGPDAPTL